MNLLWNIQIRSSGLSSRSRPQHQDRRAECPKWKPNSTIGRVGRNLSLLLVLSRKIFSLRFFAVEQLTDEVYIFGRPA